MTGTISTFFPDKGYGFVVGENGISYFLHIKEFGPAININKVVKGARVSFTIETSHKGEQATKATLLQEYVQKVEYGSKKSGTAEIHTESGDLYITPDTTFYSRESKIQGWDIIQDSGWTVVGSTRSSGESPESAKQEMLAKAKAIGANAVINASYQKTTGSSGNYNYSLHHHIGRAVIIGKRSPNGESVSSLKYDMNQAATRLVDSAQSDKDSALAWSFAIIIALTAMVAIMVPSVDGNNTFRLVASGGVFVVSVFFGISYYNGVGSYILDGYKKIKR